MKQLITLTACLMILMALLTQFVQNQKLLMQIEKGSRIVDSFCEDGDEDALRASLCRVMGCEDAAVSVTTEGDKIMVTAPVESILATPSFWGIEPERNHGRYRWERKKGHE